MKRLKAVIGFELGNYFKNKSYILTTVAIALVMVGVLCFPAIKEGLGFGNNKENTTEEGQQPGENVEDLEVLVYYDKAGVFKDGAQLNTMLPMYQWKACASEEQVSEEIKSGAAGGGYIIETPTQYRYYVNNKKMTDYKEMLLEDVLRSQYRMTYMKEHGIDAESMEQVIATPIESGIEILGKDAEGSYFYCYILIFSIYILVLLYGQLIAVGVTSEKSNRAIEVLVTSTSSNSLIFGKVIAGAIASVVQVGVILATGLLTYQIMKEHWGGILDFVFGIPIPVLITYAFFGLFGFLFYSFLYGALGATVSKTEDVGKSVAPVMALFIIGFFIALFGLQDGDTTLVKIASFVPFTSCYTMMIRVAMGSVKVYEIIISFIILLSSTVLAGWIGAKIYRMGTLHYGNPMKISTVIKRIKKDNTKL